MEQPTVLVTGATGFIGSRIVRLLLEKGGRKVVASNASGSAHNLEDLVDQVEIARAGIGNFSNVLRLVQKHRPALAALVREVFPLSPKGIIDHLKLREPVYLKTAAYGHFGRSDVEFTWERVDARDELLAKA